MGILSTILTFIPTLLDGTTNNILNGILEVIQAVLSWVTTTFTSVTALFYDATTGFTFLGYMLLVMFAFGSVWIVINFLKKITRRG